ncbi:hypothetical protein TBLA_0H02810 [Henningerozyma blattae CBS 6284]|uniref:Mitochondrial inner membrane protease subunit n=1 Tax=Henningerozyma blattae (strain ATCC 34711 / CBS 6284 / DSM 70876 / NBRC 10599 / NRRL Y-10934 / UCD 77-7) TaxID=1071380 RepID=I2H863_HENB6|nr:hypothetical protein TBLA_0H02810 [Tetrapisispora blattae CBS 6284]CCH62565.1 hypothetical protein TBLA_0H02810 [Tetrapisispora blattae CBS 6284]
MNKASLKSKYPILRNLFITATWIPVVLTITTNVTNIAQIDGISMRPTLNPTDFSKDWVLLWKWKWSLYKNLKKNDIIIFKSPMDYRKKLCKRITGIENDLITTKHPYPVDRVVLPKSHLWVNGDNTFHSIDSNTFGAISSGLVIGKVVCVIWPPSRWQFFSNDE